MRCIALAEWAVALKAKVIVSVLVDAPDLSWPCPMAVGRSDLKAKVAIQDGGGGMTFAGPSIWRIIDAPPPDLSDPILCDGAGLIYPHFGAFPINGFPTFAGPQWMPLRRPFSGGSLRGAPERTNSAVGYRSEGRNVRELRGLPAHEVAAELRWAEYAVVPPSTIAYEALACATPLRLLRVDYPCADIGAAMVDARVAIWDDEQTQGAFSCPDVIDGLGAKRILEALL